MEQKKILSAEEDLFGKCPYVTAQKVLSGKWSLLILHHLDGVVLRFGELQRRMPDLTQATLTKQLRALEEYGLVERRVYAEVPPRVEYSLTEIGGAFGKVLESLEAWGRQYISFLSQRGESGSKG